MSVDPLAPDYPFYTPYQFAGNKPINSVDLDGLEELEVIQREQPGGGMPGRATITITVDYMIVRDGIGAVTGDVDVNLIQERYTSGNTTLYATNLPGYPTENVRDGEVNFLDERRSVYSRAARGRPNALEKLNREGVDNYWEIEVVYNINITDNPNTTLEDALLHQQANRNRNGLIMEAVRGPAGEELNDLNESLSTFNANSVNAFNENLGTENKTGGRAVTGLNNFVSINGDVRTRMVWAGNGLNKIITHEAGHNMSHLHFHTTEGNGDYEYDQNGLQSNTNPRPSNKNTKNIINTTSMCLM